MERMIEHYASSSITIEFRKTREPRVLTPQANNLLFACYDVGRMNNGNPAALTPSMDRLPDMNRLGSFCRMRSRILYVMHRATAIPHQLDLEDNR